MSSTAAWSYWIYLLNIYAYSNKLKEWQIASKVSSFSSPLHFKNLLDCPVECCCCQHQCGRDSIQRVRPQPVLYWPTSSLCICNGRRLHCMVVILHCSVGKVGFSSDWNQLMYTRTTFDFYYVLWCHTPYVVPNVILGQGLVLAKQGPDLDKIHYSYCVSLKKIGLGWFC